MSVLISELVRINSPTPGTGTVDSTGETEKPGIRERSVKTDWSDSTGQSSVTEPVGVCVTYNHLLIQIYGVTTCLLWKLENRRSVVQIIDY